MWVGIPDVTSCRPNVTFKGECLKSLQFFSSAQFIDVSCDARINIPQIIGAEYSEGFLPNSSLNALENFDGLS